MHQLRGLVRQQRAQLRSRAQAARRQRRRVQRHEEQAQRGDGRMQGKCNIVNKETDRQIDRQAGRKNERQKRKRLCELGSLHYIVRHYEEQAQCGDGWMQVKWNGVNGDEERRQRQRE